MGADLKMEDTFMMVREGDGGDPLNDVSVAIGSGGKLLQGTDDMLEESLFRNLPDEAAGFEDALMRGDAELQDQPLMDGADQSMQMNFLDQSKFGALSPQKKAAELIDFEGFGLVDEDDEQDQLDFYVDEADKSARVNKRTEKLRKELAKLALGTDANICMQPKSRRQT